MSHAHRRPHHARAATSPGGQVDHNAVADEMEHVAKLLREGKIKLRNMDEVALADGWDRLTFDRKLDTSLTSEGALPAPHH